MLLPERGFFRLYLTGIPEPQSEEINITDLNEVLNISSLIRIL